MKSPVALLACVLLGTSLGSAQTTSSMPPKKPSAAVHRDSTLSRENTPRHVAEQHEQDALPVGTPIRIKLETALSTSTNTQGDSFSGRVAEAVKLNGRTIIPVGASLTGRILRSSEPRRVAGKPTLQLLPETLMMPNGESYTVSAAIVDTDAPKTEVDDEGRIKGSGMTKADKVEIVAGTGTGAVVGAVAGGAKGTLIGGAIGASVTTIHWLTKRHSADVPAGTEIIMELSRSMKVIPDRAGERQ